MYHPEQLHVIHHPLLPSLSFPLISLFHASFLFPLCFLPHLCFLLPPPLSSLPFSSSPTSPPFPPSPFPPLHHSCSLLLRAPHLPSSINTPLLPPLLHPPFLTPYVYMYLPPPSFLPLFSSPLPPPFPPSPQLLSSICVPSIIVPHIFPPPLIPLRYLLFYTPPPPPPPLPLPPSSSPLPPSPSLTPHLPSPSFPCSTSSLLPSHPLGYLPFFTPSSSSFNHPLPPHSSSLPPYSSSLPPPHLPSPSISPSDSKEKELGTNTSLLTTASTPSRAAGSPYHARTKPCSMRTAQSLSARQTHGWPAWRVRIIINHYSTL